MKLLLLLSSLALVSFATGSIVDSNKDVIKNHQQIIQREAEWDPNHEEVGNESNLDGIRRFLGDFTFGNRSPKQGAKLTAGVSETFYGNVTSPAGIKEVWFEFLTIANTALIEVKATANGNTYSVDFRSTETGSFMWRMNVEANNGIKGSSWNFPFTVTSEQPGSPADPTSAPGSPADPTSSPGSPADPTPSPSSTPSASPSAVPSRAPSHSPSASPTQSPTRHHGNGAPQPVQQGLQPDCYQNDASMFNICLDLNGVSGRYETWMESFGAARDRWQQVIVDDDGEGLVPQNFNSKYSATGLPPNKIDDCYIAGVSANIDGQGGVLGSAGPTFARRPNGRYHPLTGFMRFDKDDIAMMMSRGIWTGVILHEMGHVLGIGTLWEYNGASDGAATYLGGKANSEWKNLGCSGPLPIETDGGQGTRYSHWDEGCMNKELMTGYVDDPMYMSRITIGSLEDMGYGVDYSQADPYYRSMLDQCGSFCPEHGRNLRGSRRMDDKPRLSEAGMNQTMNEAFSILQQARFESMTMGYAVPGNNTDDDIVFMGGDLVTIYYMENDYIYDMTIKWSDALSYQIGN